MNSYSSSFLPYKTIPSKYTSINPHLHWTSGPESTKSYALIMHDIDLGTIHWMLYNIPTSMTELPEMKNGVEGLPKEVCFTTNDNGVVGYSVSGNKPRTIMFSIYALSSTLPRGLGAREVVIHINQSMIAKTRLIGTILFNTSVKSSS